MGILVLCGGLGVIVGLLACMWGRLGLFLIGGWIGGTSGMMIYNAFFGPFVGGKGGNMFFWGIISVCVIMGGVVATILFKHAIIVGSCLCGAYCLIRVSQLK